MPVTADDDLREILGYEHVAVVGCSGTPGKAAHDIPRYLLNHGYDVVPVNPYTDEIFGRATYDSLSDVEETVEVVDVFRPSDELAGIVDGAVQRDDVVAIWTQLGIRDYEAAGKRFVQDKCMKVEHQRLA